jgi:hypothetical protein
VTGLTPALKNFPKPCLKPDAVPVARVHQFATNFIMSGTVTATELQGVLEDYKIHLTGDNLTSGQAESPPTATRNPPDWPTDHRRVPDYRPVDRNRDVEGRPNGENAFERGFLTIMFTGVVMNAVSDDGNGTAGNMSC